MVWLSPLLPHPSQALSLTVFGAAATCVLPAVAYWFVFRFDNGALGPQAWAVWAAAAAGCLVGVLAHGTQSGALTLIHLVGGTLFAAALAAYTTA